MRYGSIMSRSAWRRPLAAAMTSLAGCIVLAGLMVFPATAGAAKAPGCDISVITDPPEATVVFDDKKAETLTPITLHTAPGRHFLVISKPGYSESRQRLNVAPDQTRILVDTKLEPILGLVLIHSVPPGAEITIDNAQRGQAPLLLSDLRPGSYRVKATLPGTLPVEKILQVADRVPQKLDMIMRPDSGEMKIDSTPAGAEVTVNGAACGRTPCTASGLPPGKTVITVSLEGFLPHEETADVNAGEQLTIMATLKPLPAALEVFSIPEGAVVYVENERRGKTPLTLENMSPGEYRIRTELPSYDPLARTVELKQGKRTREEFRLDRIAGTLEVTTTPSGVKVLVDNIERGVTKGDPSKPEAPSLPLVIEGLDPGPHAVSMIRKGYENVSTKVEIQKNQTAAVTHTFKKVFVPDLLIRLWDGPDDIFTGALVERYPNGDISLEIKPGIIRRFKQSEIKSEKAFTTGAPPPPRKE